MSHPIMPSRFGPKHLHDRRAEDKVQAEIELEQHKAEFFARGGQITQLPPGHSKETPIEFAHSLGPLTVERNQIKAGKDAQKYSIVREARIVKGLGEKGRPAQEYACKSCGDTDEENRAQRQHKCVPCARADWVAKYGSGKRPMETL